MSYAAYEVLSDLFPGEIKIFDQVMTDLGYELDPAMTHDLTSPEGIGLYAADSLLKSSHNDGSNQLGNDVRGEYGVPYADISGYQYVNQDANNLVALDQWTPESLSQLDPTQLQKFSTPHWGDVTSFAPETSKLLPEAPEPFLLVDGQVNFAAKTIALADGEVVINPEFIDQAQQTVDLSANLTDEQKLSTEFWEDGKGTSFPPGTWMTFGEYVSARDEHTLDEDAQLFFTLGNAVFDAGIASWKAKTTFNYARPVRVIRGLGELGLIGEYDKSLGGFAIEAWQPNQGTQTILATDFVSYQNPAGAFAPPFAEYTSGHSAFSAAAATVLKLTTGSDEFTAEVTFQPDSSRFEPGLTPQKAVTLEWNTFSEAADEAGLSRRYGGIHFEDGDLNGRLLGQEVGELVFEQAQFYINGGKSDS
jgi:hypothetical protein